MGNIDSLTGKLTAIGNAIREKTGKSDLLTLDLMPSEIQSIKGSLPVPDNKKIIFMNYDGSVVYSYTVEEALNLEALPELPSTYPFSENVLIATEWIYTLDLIKTMLTDDYYIHKGILLCPRYRYVDYYTDAYLIKIENPDLCTFYFKIYNSLNSSPSSTGIIDFGDGESVSSATYGTKTYTHTYTPESYPAYYTIKFTTNEKTYSSSYYYSTPYFANDIGKYPCHKAIIGNIGFNFFNERILHDKYKFAINGDNKALSVNIRNSSYTLTGYNFSKTVVFDLTSGNISYNYNNKKFIKRSFNSSGTAEYASGYNKLDINTSGLKYYYITDEDKDCYFPESITSIYNYSSLDGGAVYNVTIHFPSSLKTLDYLNLNYYSVFDFSKSTSVVKLTNSGSLTSNLLSLRLPIIIVPDSLYDSWKSATNWSICSNYIKKASEVSL